MPAGGAELCILRCDATIIVQNGANVHNGLLLLNSKSCSEEIENLSREFLTRFSLPFGEEPFWLIQRRATEYARRCINRGRFRCKQLVYAR